MKQLGLLLIALLALATSAFATPVVRVRTAALAGAPEAPWLEVSVAEATSGAEAESAIRWAEKDLADARSTGSSLKPELVETDLGADGLPDARDAGVTLSGRGKGSLRARVAELLAKHYRVSFTLIRGMANAGVVTWGLIFSSQVSLENALPVGIIAGSMSAGFQFFNQKYQAWLLRSHNIAGRLGRTFLVNIIYMAIAKFAAELTAIAPEHTLALAASSILKTAFLATLAQGTWNLGVASSSRLATEQRPRRKARIRLSNDFKTLAISIVSTALSVASLVGAPLTDIAMMAMTGTGAVYYSWVALKNRRWNKMNQCEANLVLR